MTTGQDAAQRDGVAGHVTQEWLDDHLAAVFARWQAIVDSSQRGTEAAILAEAEIEPGDAVLDIGCGTSVPALAVARIVGPTGRVVATDPSPIFLAALRENSTKLGLTNVETVRSAAGELPFPPGSFDAATCHNGAMFFPNLRADLERIRSVLRPGARAAFIAWGPVAENTMFGSFWGAAGPYLPPPDNAPPPDPDAPQPMRFAEPGSLSAALRRAGFRDAREESRRFELVYPCDAATLTTFWLELSRVGDPHPPERRAALETDVRNAFARFERDGAVHHSARIVVASAAA
jgi:SAM-dependent methyltransferase